MAEYFRISKRDWLEIILEKHTPVVLNAGNLRDPYDIAKGTDDGIVICKCQKRSSQTPGSRAIDYPRHIYQVLETQYYNQDANESER